MYKHNNRNQRDMEDQTQSGQTQQETPKGQGGPNTE